MKMNSQKGSFPIILGVLVFLIVIIGGVYYLGTQRNNPTNKNVNTNTTTLSPTGSSSATVSSTTPKFAAFMREGEIWVRDLTTNQEKKVSKTHPVDSPKISYDGKYIGYFGLIHGGGGFPTSEFYVADTEGEYEVSV